MSAALSHISGSFAGLDYEFAIDGGKRIAQICDDRGQPLVESTLAGGIEATTYLDRLMLYGSPQNPDPYLSGDLTAMADLARRPEAALLQQLRVALEDHGIARDLFAAPRPPKGGRQPWDASTLKCGQQVNVPTWSWWFSIAIDVWSWMGPVRFEIQDGAVVSSDTVYGWKRALGMWQRWMVSVRNLGAYPLGVDGTLL